MCFFFHLWYFCLCSRAPGSFAGNDSAFVKKLHPDCAMGRGSGGGADGIFFKKANTPSKKKATCNAFLIKNHHGYSRTIQKKRNIGQKRLFLKFYRTADQGFLEKKYNVYIFSLKNPDLRCDKISKMAFFGRDFIFFATFDCTHDDFLSKKRNFLKKNWI